MFFEFLLSSHPPFMRSTQEVPPFDRVGEPKISFEGWHPKLATRRVPEIMGDSFL